MVYLPESTLRELAGNCFATAYQKIMGYDVNNGLKQLEFVTSDVSLKGKHKVDALSELGVIETLEHSGMGLLDLYCEENVVIKPNAVGSIFVDEVDGSINMERKTGNPSFVFAYTDKTGNKIRLKDLYFAFVKSYLTGDEYTVYKGKGAKFFDARTWQTVPIKSDGPTDLSECNAYLRTGYGRAKKQIVRTLPLFFKVRDTRAFDNTAMELCELARGAVHLIVESRGISDIQNLLPYPVVKEAGGSIVSLNGKDFGDSIITENRPQDFIAASNEEITEQTLAVLEQYRRSGIKDKFERLLSEL